MGTQHSSFNQAGGDPASRAKRLAEYAPGSWLDLKALEVDNPDRVAAACVAMDAAVVGRSLVFPTPFHPRLLCTYADYTASGRALSFVEEYVARMVLPTYANTHTEASYTGLCTSSLREQARHMIMQQTNCSMERGTDGNGGDVCIFTGSGTTAAIIHLIDVLGLRVPSNLEEERGIDVRAAVEEKLGIAGIPLVLVSFMEHHSNEITWRECVADVLEVRERADGDVDLDDLREKLQQGVAEGRRLIIGSFSAGSNVTGIVPNVQALVGILHQHGALAFLDYGASAPYVQIDMNPPMRQTPGLAESTTTTDAVEADVPVGVSLAPDAVFMSPHKFPGGPGASGVLLAKRRLFTNRVPARPGGGTVAFVTPEKSFYDTHVEAREEGGTPGIVQDMRAGLALTIKGAVGAHNVELIESELVHRALAVWEHNPRIMLVGANRVAFWRRHRTSTVSFMFTILPMDANSRKKRGKKQKAQGEGAAAEGSECGDGDQPVPASSALILRKPPKLVERNESEGQSADSEDQAAPISTFGIHEYAGRADVRQPVKQTRLQGGIEDVHAEERQHIRGTTLDHPCPNGCVGEPPCQCMSQSPLLPSNLRPCCGKGGFNGGKPFHFDPRTSLMLHPHFVTQILNDVYGIQSRSGCSCAGPYGHRLFDIGPRVSELIRSGVEHGAWVLKPGWVRINTNYFLSRSEFDFIVTAIDHAATHAWRLLPLYAVDVASGQFTHHSCVRKASAGTSPDNADKSNCKAQYGGTSAKAPRGLEWARAGPQGTHEVCKPPICQLGDITTAMGIHENNSTDATSSGAGNPNVRASAGGLFGFQPQSLSPADLKKERAAVLARADAIYAKATATILQAIKDAEKSASPLRNFLPGQEDNWSEAIERTRWFALPLQHVASGEYFRRAHREQHLLSKPARMAAREAEKAIVSPESVAAAMQWAARCMPPQVIDTAINSDQVRDGQKSGKMESTDPTPNNDTIAARDNDKKTVQGLFSGEGYEWSDKAPEKGSGCVFRGRETS